MKTLVQLYKELNYNLLYKVFDEDQARMNKIDEDCKERIRLYEEQYHMSFNYAPLPGTSKQRNKVVDYSTTALHFFGDVITGKKKSLSRTLGYGYSVMALGTIILSKSTIEGFSGRDSGVVILIALLLVILEAYVLTWASEFIKRYID